MVWHLVLIGMGHCGTQVRAEAAARGIAVADKPDSYDICFIADGDTRGFLSRELGAGERSFAAALAERLGLQVCDREILEQEAVRLGVSGGGSTGRCGRRA